MGAVSPNPATSAAGTVWGLGETAPRIAVAAPKTGKGCPLWLAAVALAAALAVVAVVAVVVAEAVRIGLPVQLPR